MIRISPNYTSLQKQKNWPLLGLGSKLSNNSLCNYFVPLPSLQGLRPPPGCWGHSPLGPDVQTETAADWPPCLGPPQTCGTSPAHLACRWPARSLPPLPPRHYCPVCPPADSPELHAALAVFWSSSQSVRAAKEQRKVTGGQLSYYTSRFHHKS